MIGSSFSSLSSALALHQRARSLPRKNELSPGVWRQKRPCIRASGTSLRNWLHSWVLPRADEYSPNRPSHSGTSVPCRMHTHACVLHIDQAEITKLLNSGCPRCQESEPSPTAAEEVARAGRSHCFTDSFSSGFPASLACQTSLCKARFHLLWVRSAAERNLISYQAGTEELFGCMWPQAEAWASH